MGHSTHGTMRSSTGSSALVFCACALLAGLACSVLFVRTSAAAAPFAHVEADGEMSCDDELPLQHEALAWCSDNEGPMCLPALPAHAQAHLWDGPPAHAFATLPMLSDPQTVHVEPAPARCARPHADAAPRAPHLARLERPPRA